MTIVFVKTETKSEQIITARRSRVLIVFRPPSAALSCSEISRSLLTSPAAAHCIPKTAAHQPYRLT